MPTKTPKPLLTRADLEVGATYRAKKPRPVGFLGGEVNDRTILWIGLAEVQYDGPAVKLGHHYPKVMIAAFLKWAGEKL